VDRAILMQWVAGVDMCYAEMCVQCIKVELNHFQVVRSREVMQFYTFIVHDVTASTMT
jgi:hypothetical protein